MEKTAGRRIERRRKGQKTALGEREKRRLLQLVICLALFLTIFFAKGLDRLGQLRADLAQALQSDVDLEAAFADLGKSLALGETGGKGLEELWSVFLPQEEKSSSVRGEEPLFRNAQKEAHTQRDISGAWLMRMDNRDSHPADSPASDEKEELTEPSLAPDAVPEAGPKPEADPDIIHMDYTGPALPDNTTMDRYALGLSETVDPVDAIASSGFGWREHPISGGDKFHYGVDLAVGTGTTVRAFAAGTVEYIGESNIYGQYLQLDHGNGVTSFYAHCSKLCVQQGQRVSVGEKVAESGATGEVTGPHLHFEMKKDGVRLNPAYYLHLPT